MKDHQPLSAYIGNVYGVLADVGLSNIGCYDNRISLATIIFMAELISAHHIFVKEVLILRRNEFKMMINGNDQSSSHVISQM